MEKQVQTRYRFKLGQTGNPAGKPKGTRHKATLAAEVLLNGEAEALTRKAIELAKAGERRRERVPPKAASQRAADIIIWVLRGTHSID